MNHNAPEYYLGMLGHDLQTPLTAFLLTAAELRRSDDDRHRKAAAPDQVLIHVESSSLDPLEYKLAELNFFGREPPVILGFDLSGVVVGKGASVTAFAIGDEVAAMSD